MCPDGASPVGQAQTVLLCTSQWKLRCEEQINVFRGTNTCRRASDSWPVFTKPGCTPCGNAVSADGGKHWLSLSGDMITWRFLWETIQASGWKRSSKCFCSRKRIRGVSYLHCSSLLGSQWWCNGKTGCHRSHPQGALQANTTFNYLHNRAGSLLVVCRWL